MAEHGLTLSGLVAIALCSPKFSQRAYLRIVAGAPLVLLATVALYGYDAMIGLRDDGRYRPQQAAWPAREIAAQALAAWAQATPAPLRIVTGETRIAGLVALQAPSLPSLMTEADRWRSPWITLERQKREGMLLVWAEPGGMDPARLRALAGDAPVRNIQIAWPRTPKKPPLNLFLAVVPPQDGPSPPAR